MGYSIIAFFILSLGVAVISYRCLFGSGKAVGPELKADEDTYEEQVLEGDEGVVEGAAGTGHGGAGAHL